MEQRRGAYRQEDGVHLIEIRLSNVAQLFNSLDPAPFYEKDLDADAEAYIVDSVREFPRHAPLKLVIYLPPAERAMAETAKLTDAIRHYFSYRQQAERTLLRRELAYGRVALAIGLLFLSACIALRELALSFGPGTFAAVIAEGLAILGWVAMWRPVQIFLYDWWPIRRMCAVYERIAALPVEIRDSARPA